MKKSKKIVFISIIVLFAVIFVFSAYRIISFLIRSTTEQNYSADLSDTYSLETEKKDKAPKSVDFKALQKRNPDVVGWLYCEGTKIDYPVVKCKNNDEYIRANLEHEYSFSGTLFIDCLNKPDLSDFNTVIYGHNMYNDGTMFAVLPSYKEQSFYEKHKYMYYLTPDGDYKLEAICGGVRDSRSETYTAFEDLYSMQTYIKGFMDDSKFKSPVSPTQVKKIITLSTCSYEYWTARFALTLQVTKL